MHLSISKRRCDPDQLAVLTKLLSWFYDSACIVAALPTCNSLYKLVSITLQEGVTHPEADCILSFPLGEHKMPSKLLVKCL